MAAACNHACGQNDSRGVKQMEVEDRRTQWFECTGEQVCFEEFSGQLEDLGDTVCTGASFAYVIC